VADHEAQGEGGFGYLSHRSPSGLGVREHDASVIQEYPSAGTAIPKPFDETTLEEMDHVIELNLRGVLVAAHAALKRLKSGGRIITIGSCVGERMMTPGLVAYSATKGATRHNRAAVGFIGNSLIYVDKQTFCKDPLFENA
jgi:hypothetical protein